MKTIMIIVVAACGQMGSGGTGCGVDIDHIEFSTMELCLNAVEQMFPAPSPDASYHQRESNWQPRREIRCVNG